MPFQSEKQKKWMWANKPEMAREWTQEYGSKVKAKTGTMTKKDDKWIQKATKNMCKDKPCTGKKMNKPKKAFLGKMFRKSSTATPTSGGSSGGSSGMGGLLRRLFEEKKHLFGKAGGGPVKAQNGTYVTGQAARELPKELKNVLKLKKIAEGKAARELPKELKNVLKKPTHKIIKDEDAPFGSRIKKLEDKVTKWDSEHHRSHKVLPRKKPTHKIIKDEDAPFGHKIKKLEDKVTKWDQVKGGPTYRPGWKPQLSVRTAKKGGMPPATKYKKYLKSLKKMQTTPLSGMSTTLPPKTARLLTNLKFVYKDRGKASTALGKANRAFGKLPYVKRIPIIGKGDPSDFLKRRKQLSTAGAVGKTLLKRTGIGKAVLAATAVAGAYEAGKRKLFTKDKNKVQKKATGGEIIIGRGVDMDLL